MQSGSRLIQPLRATKRSDAVYEVLEELIVMRRRNLRLVRTLDRDELTRAGRHVERGLESLALMLPLMAGHDLVHRQQIDRIVGAR